MCIRDSNDVDLSDLYVDLSDIMSTCQIILLLSEWHLLGKNTFIRSILVTSQHKDLSSQHKDLTSQHNYLTSDGRSMPH